MDCRLLRHKDYLASLLSFKKLTSMYKIPRRVAVLGAGVMGSRIACHLAQAGAEVLLLDLPGKTDEPLPAAQQLQQVLKEKPAPLYLPDFAARIQTGSFDADMAAIATCDWILEAIVEDLKIKQKLYAQIEQHRRPATLVSSNTSGLPLSELAANCSEDFQKHFCGTHFFNPPRYLPLLELIPTPKTAPEVMAFFADYGSRFLGKETIKCKDTPAFVANRIGIFSLLTVVSAMEAGGFSVGEVDLLTGPIVGRPRSATFRTLDLVGLDVFMKVATHLQDALPKEQRALFQPPQLLQTLYKKGHWGEKRGQGFYKKVKTATGTEIHEIDPSTGQYALRKKRLFSELSPIRAQDSLLQRLPALLALEGALGDFYRQHFYALFAYCSHRLPEIADDVQTLDTALKAGFGWEEGPFQLWQALGIAETAKAMQDTGHKPASWVQEAASKGAFYKSSKGQLQVYMPEKQALASLNEQSDLLLLRNQALVSENASAKVYDIGDGIFCLASFSKMNVLNAEVFAALELALQRAETEGQGLVIGQEAPQFSAGADLTMLLASALEQEYEEIDTLVQQFQKAVLRLRYAAVPVVAATRGLTLGGGCELAMHCDQVVAHAETYIGLVEMGAGLIPAGGGTKEMATRLSAATRAEDVVMNRLQAVFRSLATAEVATSAHQGQRLGFLRETDGICMSAARLLGEAKQSALHLARSGYTAPSPLPIRVQGSAGIALLGAGIATMQRAGYATEHDAKIARKLAHVLNGGALSAPSVVTEAYLLELEREAFLSLCTEPKSLARMEHILRKGKPLRN